MTFPLDSGRDCARAWEAMPWVLQGSAPGEQAEWLSQHLEQCPACRAEFEQQQRLRLALSLPADVAVDPEAGLERLLARIDNPALAEPPRAARGGQRLVRILAAAVLVQAIGLGALGVKLWSDAPPAASYRTLSEAGTPVAPGAIHVVPDAAMKLADWDALLRALRLQVVAGPNDVGAYTVVPADRAASARQAVQQLRATRGIRMAEPASGAP